jgi:uncharacterized protein (TIGR02284 family)
MAGDIFMHENNEHVIGHLNELIEICKDEENGFREAAGRVGKDGQTELRTILNIFAQQRAEFAAELQNEVLRRGGKPAESGHVAATLRRGWFDLKSALSSGPDYADADDYEFNILAGCLAGEKTALESYEHALEKTLPSDLEAILEDQYLEIRKSLEQIRLLSHEYKPAA